MALVAFLQAPRKSSTGSPSRWKTASQTLGPSDVFTRRSDHRRSITAPIVPVIGSSRAVLLLLYSGRNCTTPRARSTSGQRNVTIRSEEHTSELQSQSNLVCRLLLEKKKARVT